MRMLFKILLFPVSLVLTILVALSNFLIVQRSMLFDTLSGLSFLLALFFWSQYFFGWAFGGPRDPHYFRIAIIFTALIFLLSSYGLPALIKKFTKKLENLNNTIKSL